MLKNLFMAMIAFVFLNTCTSTEEKGEIPELYINELLARNGSVLADPEEDALDGNAYDDWVEIYNAGSQSVDLAGMSLSDDEDGEDPWVFPDLDPRTTTINAGAYMLIWCDKESHQGTLHTNFGLSGDGEFIGLYMADGRAVDEVSFSIQQSNISIGRTSDGAAAWRGFTMPTPGSAN